MTNWLELANRVLAGDELADEEAMAILECPDEELLALLHGAFHIRQRYFGKKVKLNMIVNAKSGHCPENCGYCSQSSVSSAPIEKYPLMNKEDLLRGAQQAYQLKAGTYCIVASGRGPSSRDVEIVAEAVREIKANYNLKICACLGIIKPQQALLLKEAGVERYNHNLNTSEHHHANITTSHTYQDRVNTLNAIKEAGISPCSGVIIGMNETKADVISAARALKALDADSIPVNFLIPIEGTPLAGANQLHPRYCLKVLALFRYINPTKEIRISGGREVHLRSLQPLGLYAANSIFVGDYLTTAGQEGTADHRMLEDMGFEIELIAT
ncbi:biotin synthase BioB [Brevibacillus sp. B_LB10_24]|uniref:biotin synthase BioB n=1 Tax=Brevibacillus sp. B_LB10_24 TaxID=3380645 RepID=UPI0038BA3EFF